MPIEYEENAELDSTLKSVLSRYYARLVDHKVKIKGKLKSKTDKNGELIKSQPQRAKLIKINDLYQEAVEAKFLIIVDSNFWQNGDPRDREPALCFALDHIELNITDAGELKFKKVEPDIIDFQTNVRRFGPYSDSLRYVLEAAGNSMGQLKDPVPAPKPPVRAPSTKAKAAPPLPPPSDELETVDTEAKAEGDPGTEGEPETTEVDAADETQPVEYVQPAEGEQVAEGEPEPVAETEEETAPPPPPLRPPTSMRMPQVVARKPSPPVIRRA